jgi:hypothetical protein
MRGYNSFSFLSANLSMAMSNFHENYTADRDSEVNIENASGSKQTNTKPETEEEELKSFLHIQQGIFTRRPIFNTWFLKRVYSSRPNQTA